MKRNATKKRTAKEKKKVEQQEARFGLLEAGVESEGAQIMDQEIDPTSVLKMSNDKSVFTPSEVSAFKKKLE